MNWAEAILPSCVRLADRRAAVKSSERITIRRRVMWLDKFRPVGMAGRPEPMLPLKDWPKRPPRRHNEMPAAACVPDRRQCSADGFGSHTGPILVH